MRLTLFLGLLFQGNYLLASARNPSFIEGTPQYHTTPYYSHQYKCISFWYYMYGEEVGTLFIFYLRAGSWKEIFRIAGNRGRKWHLGMTSLTSGHQIQVCHIYFDTLCNCWFSCHKFFPISRLVFSLFFLTFLTYFFLPLLLFPLSSSSPPFPSLLLPFPCPFSQTSLV